MSRPFPVVAVLVLAACLLYALLQRDAALKAMAYSLECGRPGQKATVIWPPGAYIYSGSRNTYHRGGSTYTAPADSICTIYVHRE